MLMKIRYGQKSGQFQDKLESPTVHVFGLWEERVRTCIHTERPDPGIRPRITNAPLKQRLNFINFIKLFAVYRSLTSWTLKEISINIFIVTTDQMSSVWRVMNTQRWSADWPSSLSFVSSSLEPLVCQNVNFTCM